MYTLPTVRVLEEPISRKKKGPPKPRKKFDYPEQWSRQYAWQQRKKAEGKCTRCGKVKAESAFLVECGWCGLKSRYRYQAKERQVWKQVPKGDGRRVRATTE